MEISIIIPVYNVERYVDDCIQSILHQTFKNYEIIIDDGSTDNSGKICDKYKNKDKIHVYHTANNGVSEARNLGLKLSSGRYISFIDPDDYVATNYLEILYKLMDDNVSIGIVSNQPVLENSKFENRQISVDVKSVKILNNFQAIESMLTRNGFGVAPWGKLFKRELFNNIKFPKGKIFEDLITIPKIFKKSDKVRFLESKNGLYYWRSRKNSITRGKVDGKVTSLLTALEDVKIEFKDNLNLKDAFQARYIEDVINTLVNKLIFTDNFKKEWDFIYSYDKKIWNKFYLNDNINFLRKLRIFLLIYMPTLYQKLTIKHIKNKKSDI